MPVVPFPEWLPDQADFTNPGSPLIKNCVPLTAGSYGPMPTPHPFSTNALDERCQGAHSMKDTDGVVHMYAGDRTKLYRMQLSTASFIDATRVAGGPYATPAVDSRGFWSMTSYGNRVVATNYVDPIQSMLTSGYNFTDLSATAPKARFAATVKDFLMVASTQDAVYGPVPYRVWWSALGQPDVWPTPGSITAAQLQSDYQDLVQTDIGNITGLMSGFLGSVDAAIWCEKGIWAANYTGPPTLFGFRLVQGAPGTLSPLSLVQNRIRTAQGTYIPAAFYLAEDGFNMFDGTGSTPIGSLKFDREFLRELNAAYIGYVQGAADPISKLIYWAFASPTSSEGLFDRILVYNWELQRGVISELVAPHNRSEWLSRGTYGTPPLSLDELDPFGNLETLRPSLDDPFWQGKGLSRLSVFNSEHKLSTWVGPAMAATLDIGEMQPSPGRRSWVNSVRPLLDGGAGSGTVAIGHRDRLDQPVVWEAEVPTNILGECPQRVTGRYVRFRFRLPAAQEFQHIQGLEIDARPEGKLR